MANKVLPVAGHSPLALLMEQFVQEKRACGNRYVANASILRRFDAFLCDQGLDRCELPKSLSWQWLAKQPHESANTQRSRISVVRQFAMYMSRQGYPADVPDGGIGAKHSTIFSPRILTHAEVQQLLDAVDRLKPDAKAPMRHLIMPEVFRLLYGCGFRLNEVLTLRAADVDLVQGVLRINGAKFGKDRLVPPALPLVQRLQKYANEIGPLPADAYFFPSPHGGHWGPSSVYWLFRKMLLRCRIAHGGRGRGPRIHDLRHYSESRDMPRRLHWRLDEARDSWRSALGIVSSPATLRGATGDDRDSDVQGPAAAGAQGFVLGIRTGFFRAAAGTGVRADLVEDFDPVGEELRNLARSARD